MSESDGGPGRREVAYRVFAAEFDDADLSYKESDEERAPNYVVTPTGARVNRLFAVGVLTEVEDVNESMVRARVVDPTGAFVLYAGQYQPDALAFLERTEPPAFLAVTGKARTFEPDDGDRVYTSVRPESLNEVDAETRDRWVVGTAERTLERVSTTAGARETGLAGEELRAALEHTGVEPGLAAGIPLALDHYGTTPTYLEAVRETAIDAVRVVAGEREEVGEHAVPPDAEGEVSAGALADPEVGAATVPPGTDAATEAGTEAVATTGADAAEATPTDSVGSEEREDDGEVATDAGEEAFDLDDETRREVEAEHGVEFATGSEVADPGEADIETPEPGDGDTTSEAGGDPPAAEVQAEGDEVETAQEEDAPGESGMAPGTAESDDLVDRVLETMADLDDGDGADRAALVDAVASEAGVDTSVVEDALEEALKRGRCYEPADGRLKPI